MDKKEINKLMEQRNQIQRDPIKPVEFFESSLSENKDSLKSNKMSNIDSAKDSLLVKYTTYLTNDLITKIKIKAALTRKKSYQIIQQALEEFLEKWCRWIISFACSIFVICFFDGFDLTH